MNKHVGIINKLPDGDYKIIFDNKAVAVLREAVIKKYGRKFKKRIMKKKIKQLLNEALQKTLKDYDDYTKDIRTIRSDRRNP